MRLAYLPVVDEEGDLVDLISRAAWFLTFSSIERISVFVVTEELGQMDWRVAPGMDPAIAERFERLRPLVEFVPAPTADELKAVIGEADMVLRWRQESIDELPGQKRMFTVDPLRDRYEGSFYIEVGLALMRDCDEVIRRSRERFARLTSRVGRRDRAYVLATGPSVGRYSELDFDGALTVACNSVILDHDLMAAVEPEIVVFADPIFHFGPSQYAASFRRSLLEAARMFDFTICIPLKYHDVFTAAVPELAERTIAIPHRKDRPHNFDLTGELELKTTANVLTYLMLPLAGAFADEIAILGCDGRPRSDSGYFWSHNRNTQIHDKLGNIREVHPAFFAIDYDEYYDEHIETLEEQLQEGEAQGLRFRCLSFSHIPPLQRRMAPSVVIVDPDALDWNGHFMAYNDKLTDALTATGASVRVLCNRKLAPEIRRARPHFAAALSCHSWSLGIPLTPSTEALAAAEAELAAGVDLCVDGDRGGILYMYTGSVAHAAMVARILRERPELSGRVNLFWSAYHSDHWEEWVARHRELLSEINSTPRLTVTVPTEGVRKAIADSMGELFDVAPHPSTMVSDQAFEADAQRTAGAEGGGARAGDNGAGRFRILFPGAARGGKGFATTLETARRLSENSSLEPVVRYAPDVRQPNPEEEAAVTRLSERVTVVGGDLTNDAFEDLFRSCQVCVLPYEPASFRNRTSGLLIDSVYYGLPVVATAGTWLGDFVARFGCGTAVDDTRPERLTRAIEEVVEQYPAFVDRARFAARSYFAGNSWQALVDSILAPDSPAIVGPFPRSAEANLDEATVVAKLMRSSRGPRGVMVDVGAHHGASFSHFAQAGWRVIACEPDADNRAVLTKRIGSSGVTVDPRAVSDEPAAEAPFFHSDESTGVSALHAFTPGHRSAGVVAVTTIEEIAATYDLPRIDFLKIDVEGFDGKVLKGVPWDRIRPGVITCEFDDEKTTLVGYSYREMADYLVERGYTVYVSEWHPIVAYGIPHQWRQLIRYPDSPRSTKAWGNFIAFRTDPGLDAVARAFRSCLQLGDRQGRAAPRGRDGIEERVANLIDAHETTKAELDRKLAELKQQQSTSQRSLVARLTELERAIIRDTADS